MPINKETIISVFNEKLTLEQWLKTINKALDEAVLTGVQIVKKGNATLSFKFTFEDGTFLETDDIVLQQGESVNNAYIQNGHLYLTLTNGTNLDAGNVKPVSNFSINDSQHLIVNYGDGTSQDLGAIFNGDVNIDGKLTANSIIENMEGYSANVDTSMTENVTLTPIYSGIVKNGNKITFTLFSKIETSEAVAATTIWDFIIPSVVGTKLFPIVFAGSGRLDLKTCYFASDLTNGVTCPVWLNKDANTKLILVMNLSNLTPNTEYLFRYEITFLLSDNLAQ